MTKNAISLSVFLLSCVPKSQQTFGFFSTVLSSNGGDPNASYYAGGKVRQVLAASQPGAKGVARSADAGAVVPPVKCACENGGPPGPSGSSDKGTAPPNSAGGTTPPSISSGGPTPPVTSGGPPPNGPPPITSGAPPPGSTPSGGPPSTPLGGTPPSGPSGDSSAKPSDSPTKGDGSGDKNSPPPVTSGGPPPVTSGGAATPSSPGNGSSGGKQKPKDTPSKTTDKDLPPLSHQAEPLLPAHPATALRKANLNPNQATLETHRRFRRAVVHPTNPKIPLPNQAAPQIHRRSRRVVAHRTNLKIPLPNQAAPKIHRRSRRV
ncbi:hypothetical protein KEM48_005025 [Puccinia striiformis f. sp. tritici PST-130]|nr:hypothetical protein KEM48_005025 [Puccinia striiformis f. sp. tritici PST-130]